MQPLDTAASVLKESRYAVALTGAGISTPSGIPDFRSPGTGLWEKVDPVEVATIWAFTAAPRKVFDFLAPLEQLLARAEPNSAHQALAQLEAKGRLKAVITQNIDGLHQKAGSQNVIEVHGNTRQVVCLRCRKKEPMEVFRQMMAKGQSDPRYYPTCACGGLLKPDVTLFGEALPEEAMAQALAHARSADAFLVAGSSLTVQPAASLPQLATENGARLLIVNLQPTPLDDKADALIRAPAEEALPLLAARV